MGKRTNRKRRRLAAAATTDEPDASKPQQNSPTQPPNNHHSTKKICCDLHVPLQPFKLEDDDNDDDQLELSSELIQRQVLLHRLESVGYTHVGFTHVVYGAPNSKRDRAEETLALASDTTSIQKRQTKKSKHGGAADAAATTFRRLHAVVENLSDVGLFVATTTTAAAASAPSSTIEHPRRGGQKKRDDGGLEELFRGYDLISLAPGNALTFQAACATATACDIITLDYYTQQGGGGALPYRIRPADVRAAMARKAVFEIPYAPAILSSSSKIRRKLVQACRELQQASAGLKPKIIFSSGPRTYKDERFDGGNTMDAEDMAIRTPGDIQNLIRTVLQFDDDVAVSNMFSTNAEFALKRGMERRFGNAIVQEVRWDEACNVKNHEENVGRGGIPLDTAISEKERINHTKVLSKETSRNTQRPTSQWGSTKKDSEMQTVVESKHTIQYEDAEEDDTAGDGFIGF